ncbi:hypothetical protein ACTXT7_009648 [Hymenolepis weldensis]
MPVKWQQLGIAYFLILKASHPNLLITDIHDFLSEPAAASRKTRDKRKRKTPKTYCSEPTKTFPDLMTSPGSANFADKSFKNDPHQHANLFITPIAAY